MIRASGRPREPRTGAGRGGDQARDERAVADAVGSGGCRGGRDTARERGTVHGVHTGVDDGDGGARAPGGVPGAGRGDVLLGPRHVGGMLPGGFDAAAVRGRGRGDPGQGGVGGGGGRRRKRCRHREGGGEGGGESPDGLRAEPSSREAAPVTIGSGRQIRSAGQLRHRDAPPPWSVPRPFRARRCRCAVRGSARRRTWWCAGGPTHRGPVTGASCRASSAGRCAPAKGPGWPTRSSAGGAGRGRRWRSAPPHVRPGAAWAAPDARRRVSGCRRRARCRSGAGARESGAAPARSPSGDHPRRLVQDRPRAGGVEGLEAGGAPPGALEPPRHPAFVRHSVTSSGRSSRSWSVSASRTDASRPAWWVIICSSTVRA